MAVRTSAPTERDDRMLASTRVVAIAIVPFLLVAVAVLYPVPGDTQRLFAWHIVPTLTAMLLGSAYLGGAYFFLGAARASAWSSVKGGFLPVALFATLMGIATVIHWDKFNHRHVAFWLWALLYFTTPFLVFWVWWRNWRYGRKPTPDERRLTPAATRIVGGAGALAGVTGLFLFLAPSAAIAVWPWSLTPLTARVVGAVLCLGLAGPGIFADNRWSVVRLPLQAALIMMVLVVVAGLRAYHQFDPANPLTWILTVGVVGLTVSMGVLYWGMERRA